MPVLLAVLIAAAVLGDAANYFLGKNYGAALVMKIGGRFIKKKHLEEGRRFYDQYGWMAISLGRFIPVVRTFVPFVAGMSKMKYRVFGIYNIIGGVAWVALFLTVGYYFGNMPFVQQNFSIVVLAIIVISLLPILIKYLGDKRRM